MASYCRFGRVLGERFGSDWQIQRVRPEDIFIELVSGLAAVPLQPRAPDHPPPGAFSATGELIDPIALQIRGEYEKSMRYYADYRNRYETALNSEAQARVFFRSLLGQVSGEAEAVQFLETAYGVLVSYGKAALVDRFRAIVDEFILEYSLRYELREQFSLHATVAGVFAKLISEVKKIAIADAHLSSLLSEFEESFADLKSNRTQARIKTCLQKQFNLLEALGSSCPNVTGTTLGAICNQLDFPHATIRAVGEKLYGFGSNYPGVRHAGNANSALRQLDMRDFVSLSLMLVSFTPYVTHGLDSDRCYSG